MPSRRLYQLLMSYPIIRTICLFSFRHQLTSMKSKHDSVIYWKELEIKTGAHPLQMHRSILSTCLRVNILSGRKPFFFMGCTQTLNLLILSRSFHHGGRHGGSNYWSALWF